MSILSAFFFLLFFSAGLITFFSYFNALSTMNETSMELIENVSSQAIEKTINHLSPAKEMSFLISNLFPGETVLQDNFGQFEQISISSMETYPQLEAINFGFLNDNFYMVKRDEDGTFSTKIIRRDVEKPYVEWRYRNEAGKVINTEIHYKPDYKPTERPWFIGAIQTKSFFMSDVYIFFTDKVPGITIGHPVFDKENNILGVLSYDISLAGISRFLQTLKIGKNGKAFILNDKKEIVAHPEQNFISVKINDDGTPALNLISEKKDSVEFHLFDLYNKMYPGLEKNGNELKLNHKGENIIGYFFSFPEEFRKNWTVAVYVPENDFIGPIKRNFRINLLLIGLIFVIAILLSVFFSNMITKPINLAADELHRIKKFNLSNTFTPSSLIKEIYLFENDICEMKNGLESFEKYLPEMVIKHLSENDIEQQAITDIPEITVLFSEIEDFSLMTKKYEKEVLVQHLNEYFDLMTDEIKENYGILDKFVGDSIMAFWGVEKEDSLHIQRAVTAGLNCIDRNDVAISRSEITFKPTFKTRIGIHSGPALVGNIGTKNRLNYTAIGETIKLAYIVERINKLYLTKILITHTTAKSLKGSFPTRFIDRIIIKGRDEGIDLFEPILPDKFSDVMKNISSLSLDAFEFYKNRDWENAEKIYRKILELKPNDTVAKIFIERIKAFKNTPPGSDWKATLNFSYI